jgi:hypothetical protein
MTLVEPIEVTLAVTAVLERLGVDYVVGGSLATSLHGIPRATLDVDIVADLRIGHLQGFVAALEGDFFVDGDMVKNAIRRRATFKILHLATMFKVDVFVVGVDELLVAEMAPERSGRAPRAGIGGVERRPRLREVAADSCQDPARAPLSRMLRASGRIDPPHSLPGVSPC